MKSVPEPIRRELCARFSGDPSTLMFLGGGQDWSDGVLFTFAQAGAAAPAASKVLKILAFKTEDARGLAATQDRVRLVAGFKNAGARIILPEPSTSGAIFETVEHNGSVYAAYTYALAPGRPLDKKDRLAHSSAYYRATGDLLGRLHAASESRKETLTPDGKSSEAGAVGCWRDEWESFRGWCKDEDVGRAWERLGDWLATLPVDKACYGFVHNDAHIWNLLFDPESPAVHSGGEPELTVIDFDCANYHWFMTDAATTLYSTLMMASGETDARGGVNPTFRDKAFAAFWEGYRRHKDPGREWLDLLDHFLQYRRCLLFMPFQEETAKHPTDSSGRRAAATAAPSRRIALSPEEHMHIDVPAVGFVCGVSLEKTPVEGIDSMP
jgi:Ser/Thr protein kinase RdoA (MazF antagonist)